MEGFKKDDLEHWGIKGQKWGVRRFQNKDGTLTVAGIKRYRQAVRDNRSNRRNLKSQSMQLYRARRKGTLTNAIYRHHSDMAPTESEKYTNDPLRTRRKIEREVVKKLEKKLDQTLDQGKEHVKKMREDYGYLSTTGISKFDYKDMSRSFVRYHLNMNVDTFVRGIKYGRNAERHERDLRQMYNDEWSKVYEEAREELKQRGELGGV